MIFPSYKNSVFFRTLALIAIIVTVFLSVIFYARAQNSNMTAQTNLPRIEMTLGMYRIHAQVASTPFQRQVGLMWRQGMAENEGMLFIFKDADDQCFWMKNTLIPLSAAFIAEDGMIVNIVDMEPKSLESKCSSQPVRFVLEMNQGWFDDRGFKAGSRILGDPFTPPSAP